MHYKKLFFGILPLVLFNLSSFSQSLILDKINNIELKAGSSEIKQIIPLPDKQIAVSLTTSDYTLGGEFEQLSFLSKDTSIQIFHHYKRPYEIGFIQLSTDEQLLYVFKRNRPEERKDVWLYRYNLGNLHMDSLDIPMEYWYKHVALHQNDLSFFGVYNENDSLLLEQTYSISDESISEIWLTDTIKKSFDAGNKYKDYAAYSFSTPTYGSNNPKVSTNYLIVKNSEGYQQIEFNSSNKEQNDVAAVPLFNDFFNPVFPVNDSIVYVAYQARKKNYFDFSHINYILASYNIKQSKLNWQYHGLDRHIFNYINATPNGVHLYYKGTNTSLYEFINTKGERIFEDDNSEIVRYCTQNDECIVYRNDTLFLKKFGEVLAYYAFENLDQYNMLTFHPDDKHHYVSLREKGGNTMSIYQLKLDTLDTGVFNAASIETFSLYPNPANTSVNLELPVFQKYDLEIINLNGQVVERLAINGKIHVIQPKYLEEGTYWLKATGQNKQTYVSRLLWLR